MDFSAVALTEAQQKFSDEVRAFLDEHLTEEVYAGARERTDHFDEGLWLAMGAKGWLQPQWKKEDGGAELDDICVKILENELRKRDAPVAGGANGLIWPAVDVYGVPDLREELKPKVADGTARFVLGYSEPDGGSDIANAKTRAERDGDEWVINGQKIFTTSAQNGTHVFLITRTDPNLPKHKGLTMFLVPMDTPGIEVQALPTVGDERTNLTYYGDVRISDRYRLGEVNNGWSVLHGPLDAEHSIGGEASKLEDLSIGTGHMRYMLTAVEAATKWAKDAPDGDGPMIDDKTFLTGLGHMLVEIEAAYATPGPDGPDQGRRRGHREFRAAHRPGRTGGHPALRRRRHHRQRRDRGVPPGGPGHRDLRRHHRGVPDHHRPASPRPARGPITPAARYSCRVAAPQPPSLRACSSGSGSVSPRCRYRDPRPPRSGQTAPARRAACAAREIPAGIARMGSGV